MNAVCVSFPLFSAGRRRAKVAEGTCGERAVAPQTRATNDANEAYSLSVPGQLSVESIYASTITGEMCQAVG